MRLGTLTLSIGSVRLPPPPARSDFSRTPPQEAPRKSPLPVGIRGRIAPEALFTICRNAYSHRPDSTIAESSEIVYPPCIEWRFAGDQLVIQAVPPGLVASRHCGAIDPVTRAKSIEDLLKSAEMNRLRTPRTIAQPPFGGLPPAVSTHRQEQGRLPAMEGKYSRNFRIAAVIDHDAALNGAAGYRSHHLVRQFLVPRKLLQPWKGSASRRVEEEHARTAWTQAGGEKSATRN